MTSKTATSGAKSRIEAPCPLAVISPVIRSGTPQGAGTDCPEALEFADLQEIRDILDINALVWLDLDENRSVPPTRSQLVDLIADGRVVCRIAADRRTGAVQLSEGLAQLSCAREATV